MLMIRLQRFGRKNDPSFRVVLTDKRNSPKSRNFVEILGNYDVKSGKTVFNTEKIKYWISKGAQLSITMHNFLISQKVIAGKKINALSRKSPIKKEGSEAPVVETPAKAPEVKTEEPKEEVASAPEEVAKEEVPA